ncbi:MAG: MarR family transcriptional regulator [Actinobacteria bacterium]|nr:MAG: MarR family transcriptional regulator [Actinomycetota bacterium]
MDPLFEFALSVKALQRELERGSNELMKPLGLTGPQADALVVIGHAQPIALKDLGRLLIAEAGHPSRLVDRLVDAGLVERRAAEDDRFAQEHVARGDAGAHDRDDGVLGERASQVQGDCAGAGFVARGVEHLIADQLHDTAASRGHDVGGEVLELELTPAGRRLARRVEKARQDLFDASRPHVDEKRVAAATALLRRLLEGTPAGELIARRHDLAGIQPVARE